MKNILWMMFAVALVSSMMLGCGKSGVNTSKLESSFQSSEPAQKSTVDQAVDSIKVGNYQQAMASLQKVAAQAKLTPEQQQAINDVIAQIQKQLTATANKAARDAQKAATDMQKSLGR